MRDSECDCCQFAEALIPDDSFQGKKNLVPSDVTKDSMNPTDHHQPSTHTQAFAEDRPRCSHTSRGGHPCRGVVRYSAPLRRYASSCRQHLSGPERKAFDEDPKWSQIGQVLWLLQQADSRSRPLLRTIEIAHAMRIHQTRASELLNDLECLGFLVATRKGRQLFWSRD
ncbi:hypothetical protein [Amycolatopsis thailandensis]|uniref:hypothetical protein n=1 Tax=Amycolatopsis thailandensis TaxID=589330 RepID=UPI003645EB33